ncbi:MAG TPA: hypothetical protein VEH05_04165 [Streptosporangiaceae bacterium]|nr:hypothetical protein [Streptosporangiaceae bacterium]
MPERAAAESASANPPAAAAATARRMWTLFEPIHIVSYFAAEPRQAFERAGVRGYWRGYFAGRAAPLGEVGAGPVTAAFFSFAPAMVGRAVPGVWALITPGEALAVRQAGAVAALRQLVGHDGLAVAAAADYLAEVAAGLTAAGHVLGAANLELPVPAEPLARLWHAATVLREHRGDGHVAALVAADLDGAEALALRAGVDLAARGARSQESGGWTRDQLQPIRGWTDADWDAAVARLADRGLVRPDGAATAAGTALHQGVEDATDQAAARPWSRLPVARAVELDDLLRPIARACAAVLPFPHPASTADPAPR